MKKITKDNKGITLISLIITIIILSILISVITYSGISSYKNAKITSFVVQMQLIQSKVDNLVGSKSIEEIESMGFKEIATEEQKNVINSAYNNNEITTNIISEYKLFETTDLLEFFDIDDMSDKDNIVGDILINFTTREVISVNGIEYEGTTYYTQYKLPNGQTIIQNIPQDVRDLEFSIETIIDGLNATITINNIKITNGTLSYREENDSYWNTITNHTISGNAYSISISKSGTYEIVLTDNATGENSNTKKTDELTGEILEIVPDKNKITLLLANAPKTNQQITNLYDYSMNSDNWAAVEYKGVSYVWIPRVAYKAETGQRKFLKGNSDIATDNTYIDDTWTIHEKFTNSGIELTGVWVNINIQIKIEDIDRVLSDASYDIKTEINL